MAEGVVIRPECDADHPVIAEVVRASFVGHADEVASFVERIRASEQFIPELALVAEDASGVIAHVLLSWVGVEGGSRTRMRLVVCKRGVPASVNHLALAVSDQARSTRFYVDYFGFVPEPEPREDGVLILHDAGGFSLALGEIDEPVVLPPFLHFGRRAASPHDVHSFRDRIQADGLDIVDWWDEPDYVSVKFRDPDGYVIEVGWDAARATGA